MNNKIIFNIIFLILFISVFLFQIIPIPVENSLGSKLPDEYIFGGFYYTSILYQLEVGNYVGSGLICSMFLVLFGTNHLLNKEGEINGIV